MAFKIKQSMYLGFGLQLDGYSRIRDEKLRLGTEDELITSHYAYSKRYGFDTANYNSSSLHASFFVDKHDNMIRPYDRYFLSLGWRGAMEFLGSQKNANMLKRRGAAITAFRSATPRTLSPSGSLVNFRPKVSSPT